MLKKLKSLFSAKPKPEQGKNLESPVDLNKPVENPELSLAIERLVSDQSDAAKDHLLAALNQANYLAVIITDEMHTSEIDEDGKTVIEAGSKIKIVTTNDERGNAFLPLFTDWPAIRQYIQDGLEVSTLVLPAYQAWDMALSGNYHGVVVNPGGNALPLNAGQIAFLRDQATPGKQ